MNLGSNSALSQGRHDLSPGVSCCLEIYKDSVEMVRTSSSAYRQRPDEHGLAL